LSFDDDFRDLFDDFDIFTVIKRSQNEMEKILKKIGSGDLKGKWEITQIDEPDLKGFTIRGRFGTEMPMQPLEPIEPIRPSTRRPLPEKPFELSKAALKEMREPLVDIFEEEGQLRVYVELPGVEKENIKLNFGKDCVEVKARNFYKTIQLPYGNAQMNTVSTEYKNGVLEIIIPREKKLREKDAKNLRAV
jgi:HSP20 family molecular chaperone IbpA